VTFLAHLGQEGRRWLRCRSGGPALETAAVFPMVILLLYGAVEISRMLSLRNSLQFAVERATRCAVVDKSTCGSATTTANYASGQVYGAAVPSSDFTVTYPSCGVSISASATFTPLVPLNLSYSLTAKECRPYQ
jgi:Flp pilus assembly protein TadG